MKNLVLVNGNLSDFEVIQAAVESAEKYADNVEVISSHLARFTYALKSLMKVRHECAEDVILIVTLTSSMAEFTVLCRDENYELYVHEHVLDKPDRCMELFPQIYKDFSPEATIFVHEDGMVDLAREVDETYRPRNQFFKNFERWDYILHDGGLHRARNEDDGHDTRYKIANFSNGIDTEPRGKQRHRAVLLNSFTRVPCKIFGFDGEKQPVKVCL